MSNQWTVEEAKAWGDRQPWGTGFNFLPSTAINQLELWQAESFDPATIDRELGFAEGIGMSLVRVYLHDLVYEADPEGFLSRVDQFLGLCAKHHIRALIVFFDDCWNPEAALGPQPAPKVGVHNSGWVRSPQDSQRSWPGDLDRLKTYVTAVLTRFSDDERVYGWDLYNEPGNSHYGSGSLALLSQVFEWAWAVRPSQPLTVGVWFDNEELNKFQLENSDIVSFHNYHDVPSLEGEIERLRSHNRPILCTEWMARTQNSLVTTHLPVFKREGVSCINWGLVAGKMNTQYAWGTPEGSPEPEVWFHELFHTDGTPYSVEETELFRELTR